MTDFNSGLSSKEALSLERRGLSNRERKIKINSYLSIIRRNIFTFFNLINIILAAIVFFVSEEEAEELGKKALEAAIC